MIFKVGYAFSKVVVGVVLVFILLGIEFFLERFFVFSVLLKNRLVCYCFVRFEFIFCCFRVKILEDK